MTLKFYDLDTGNCRAYYRDSRKIYCIQDETSWGRPNFKFYRCSRDGEPSHEVAHTFPDLGDEYNAQIITDKCMRARIAREATRDPKTGWLP